MVEFAVNRVGQLSTDSKLKLYADEQADCQGTGADTVSDDELEKKNNIIEARGILMDSTSSKTTSSLAETHQKSTLSLHSVIFYLTKI